MIDLDDAWDALPGGVGAGRQIVGGSGSDRIDGTESSDDIYADPVPVDDRGGDDQVWGYGGDDRIRGFGGDNELFGGPGDDQLITADGRDRIFGGPGNDEIQGGRETDTLWGGPGDDEIRGGEGDDTLYGEAGLDRVIGSSGNDILHGGLGADELEGREGLDTFVWTGANEGRDTILDFELGIDRLLIGDFLRGYSGRPGTLGRHVRLDSSEGQTVLQVDADGRGPGGWSDLATLSGVGPISARALNIVGDLLLAGHEAAPAFSALGYIASYDDLIAAFGTDDLAGKRHFVGAGYAERRTVTFDGLQYIAGNADLIEAFGAQPEAGTRHFIRAGHAEGRARDSFDEKQYLANYADLRAAFGQDYEAATRHYIEHGHAETRTDDPLGASDFMF